jgi:hypothetical protein
VFNVHHSCRLARQAGALHVHFDPNQYIAADGSFRYPDPTRVYLLKHEYMRPDLFHSYMWPHIVKPKELDLQRRMYIRQFMRARGEEEDIDPIGDDDEGEEEGDRETALSDIYEQYHRCNVSDANAMDMNALRRRQKVRMDDALRLAGDDITKLRGERLKAQKEGLEEFSQLFHVTGDVPNSIRAIAKWKDAHIASFRNFRMPMKKQSKNLSRFGDLFACLAVQMECIFKVATLQAEVIHGFIKNEHVYSNTKFHAHTLFMGPPKVGKTYTFQVQQECYIPGTWQEYAYQTPKANTSPGKAFNHLIEFLEEAPPTMLGVVHQFGGKRQPTAGTDIESMLKLKLTRGKMIAKILVIDPDTGERKTLEIEVDCNTVMNFASNENQSSINPAMLSRFAIRVFQYKDRPDAGGLLGKMQSSASRPLAKMRRDRIYRLQRNQAVTAMIFYLIDAEILAPIDLTAANIIFSEVMKRGKALGLTGTDDVRNFERLCFEVEVLVIWDAIDILFDSEVSPFEGKAFNWTDLLMFEPYLKATVEHCTFALGLLHDQFESDVVKNVVRTLKETAFARAVLADKTKKEPYPGVEREIQLEEHEFAKKYGRGDNGQAFHAYCSERQDKIAANREFRESSNALYFVITYPPVSIVPTSSGGSSSAPPRRIIQDKLTWTKDELVTKLSQELHVKMSPRPQLEDLRHALDLLTALPIANEMGETTGSDFALQFADGKAYLSKTLLKGYECHSLKTIITEVLERVTLTKRQYIYGATYDNKPYIWNTIVVRPSKQVEPVEVIDPNYFDEQVRLYDAAAGEDMYNELLEPGPEHDKAARARFFVNVFSSAPAIRLDTSLDRYVALKRLCSLGVTSKDMAGLPSPFPYDYQKQILEATAGENLQDYPRCFKLTTEEVAADMKRKRPDEEVSMRAKCQKMIETLGFDLAEEKDEEVCELVDQVENDLQELQLLERNEEQLLARAGILLTDEAVDTMASELGDALNLDAMSLDRSFDPVTA